jgi:hypothetical protein
MFNDITYEPDTGVFTSKISQGRIKAGGVMGYVDPRGYTQIRVAGKSYLAHRLAWFMHYGYWPTTLDHINGSRSDNRICNLRMCNPTQNNWNRGSDKNSSSRFKGVTYVKNRGKWQASIDKIYLGYFSCEYEAALVYNSAAEKRHGEFVRLNNVFLDFEVDCPCDM